MNKITRADAAMGFISTVARFAGEWRPPRLRGETAYRNEFCKVLRAAVPSDCKVESEYRHIGTTADVWLKWTGFVFNDEVFFELKVNLTKKTDYDRLVGQIEGIVPAKNKLIVMLIGDTKPDILGRLNDRYAAQLRGEAMGATSTMAIVCVPLPDAPA